MVKKLRMTGWYNPVMLVQTGIRVAISTIFGQFADKREALAAANAIEPQPFDSSFDYCGDPSRDGDFWFDFIGECLSEAVYDTVKNSLDAAIDQFIKDPLSDAMDETRANMLGEEYEELYQKATKAWELYQQAQAIIDDPIGQTIDKIPGVDEGKKASEAGKRIGGAFGFRLYLMLTMGRDIAEFASLQ